MRNGERRRAPASARAHRASSRRTGARAEALAPVAALLDRVAPAAIVEVPAHGAGEPAPEAVRGLPAELALDLGCVDRVAAVVAGPVGHERLERGVAREALGLERGVHRRGQALVEDRAEAVDDLHVRPLVAPAD